MAVAGIQFEIGEGPLYDRRTAEITPASMFVATLSASNYTFARAALSQDLGNWVESHVAAFEYYQGTPKLVVPDNLRTGLDRACRYEPDLNRTYRNGHPLRRGRHAGPAQKTTGQSESGKGSPGGGALDHRQHAV